MTTLVDVTVKVPKELNDVRVALVALITDIKQGKPFAVVAVETFPLLLAAVTGAQALGDEVKAEMQKSSALIGLMGGELVGALVG